MLPVFRAFVDSLPASLDGIVATGDLQGREIGTSGRLPRLVGEVVAEEMAELLSDGVIPLADRLGVLLAGDMYARPELDRRGGNGDVRDVWRAFANNFKWVAGVAGNHDFFGVSPRDLDRFSQEPRVHFLNANAVDVDGLRVGGVSGIVGKPTRPFRRTESDFLKAIGLFRGADLHILVLHEGPASPDGGSRGNQAVGNRLADFDDLLVICGHGHWKDPINHLSPTVQVMNVDERVMVLLRHDAQVD